MARRSKKQIFFLCQAGLLVFSQLVFCHLGEAQITQNQANSSSLQSRSSSQTKGADHDDLSSLGSPARSDQTVAPASASAKQGSAAIEEGQNQESKSGLQLDSGLQVFLPPVLEKNKPVWGSIYDSESSLLADQKILINNLEIQSDEFGSFSFTAPADDSLTIAVLDDNGRKVWQTKYSTTGHGLFVSDKSAAEMIDKLDELSLRCGGEPIISHAPSIVEPLQTFVVIGKNFGGKQGDNDVEIDDTSSDILAASTRSLVAVSARFIKLGPVKELKVSNRNLSSLPTELDVSRADLKFEPAEKGKNKLRVNIIGSTLPAAVSVVNQAPNGNMRFGGWRLGRQNIFLSPGGQRNAFEIDVDASLSADTAGAHIISNGIFDPYSMRTTRSLLSKAVADAGERAEAIRLRKREIALEGQLTQVNQDRQARLNSGKLAGEEDSKFETSVRALSSRLYRVGKMLQARHAVLESDGAADYSKLLDAAANNTLQALEEVIASKDLGFTEARLLKVVGRRAAEEQAQGASAVYMPQYTSPPAAFLQSYRKKYGKRGFIPPPPQTAILLPPPAPYRPTTDDLGPLLTELPLPKSTSKAAGKTAKKRKAKKGAGSTTVSSVKTSHLHKQSNKTHQNHKVGFDPQLPSLLAEC